MYSIQENNFINVSQKDIAKALKKYLEVRNEKTSEETFNNYSNDYLDKGMCRGLSHLWAFSQRQEERNTEDNDLYTISKLRILLNKLHTWCVDEGNPNKIDWYEKDKKRDKELIKSEDIEILLSTINILHNPPEQFPEISKAIPLRMVNIGQQIFSQDKLQGFYFFESVEKNNISNPKVISYYPPYAFSSSNLQTELKKVLETGSLIIIGLSSKIRPTGHGISIYMKQDEAIIFYDPNLGEKYCGQSSEGIKNAGNKIFEGLKEEYVSFRIEKWCFGDSAQESVFEHKRQYIFKNNQEGIFKKIKKQAVNIINEKNFDINKIEELTSFNSRILEEQAIDSYNKLLCYSEKLSPEQINALTQNDALKLAIDKPKLYEKLLNLVWTEELNKISIEQLTSKTSYSIAKSSPDSYEKIIHLHLIYKNMIASYLTELLTTENAYVIATKNLNLYKKLLNLADAKTNSFHSIRELTKDNALVLFHESPKLYEKLLDLAFANKVNYLDIPIIFASIAEKGDLSKISCCISAAVQLNIQFTKFYLSKNYTELNNDNVVLNETQNQNFDEQNLIGLSDDQ
jgi:hypothetical protein